MPPGTLLRWGSWIYLALAVTAVLWLGLRDGAIPLALFFDLGAWWADLAAGGLAAAAIVGLWHLGLLALPSAGTCSGQAKANPSSGQTGNLDRDSGRW